MPSGVVQVMVVSPSIWTGGALGGSVVQWSDPPAGCKADDVDINGSVNGAVWLHTARPRRGSRPVAGAGMRRKIDGASHRRKDRGSVKAATPLFQGAGCGHRVEPLRIVRFVSWLVGQLLGVWGCGGWGWWGDARRAAVVGGSVCAR